ncbi:hypothetical protein [Azoarcus sp. KH32C]|uniref:hypothetical protein n=1 Tax=Azoarcus sp. KH32C TaxID=748247 RepID=UPI000347CA0D|nr:hypothetical protein [Azoarcus sp. KH32C]
MVHARAAEAAVTVEGFHSLTWNGQPTAAKLCHQLGAVATTGSAVEFFALGGALEQQRERAKVAEVIGPLEPFRVRIGAV